MNKLHCGNTWSETPFRAIIFIAATGVGHFGRGEKILLYNKKLDVLEEEVRKFHNSYHFQVILGLGEGGCFGHCQIQGLGRNQKFLLGGVKLQWPVIYLVNLKPFYECDPSPIFGK